MRYTVKYVQDRHSSCMYKKKKKKLETKLEQINISCRNWRSLVP